MRRPTFVGVSLVALAVLSSPSLLWAQALPVPPPDGGMAYINSQAILAANPGVQQAQAQLSEDIAGFRAQVQQLADDLDQMIQQYQQQQLTLSPDAKLQREADIRQRQEDYQNRVAEIDQQATQREAELVQPIMAQINQVIENIREERSYTLIFDVSVGAIIAADPALDITEEVIRRLGIQPDTTGTGN